MLECYGQPRQLNPVFRLLNRFPFLITLIHGDRDDFAPIEVARAIADTTLVPARFIEVVGGQIVEEMVAADQVLACLESAINPRGALRDVRTAEPASMPLAS